MTSVRHNSNSTDDDKNPATHPSQVTMRHTNGDSQTRCVAISATFKRRCGERVEAKFHYGRPHGCTSHFAHTSHMQCHTSPQSHSVSARTPQCETFDFPPDTLTTWGEHSGQSRPQRDRVRPRDHRETELHETKATSHFNPDTFRLGRNTSNHRQVCGRTSVGQIQTPRAPPLRENLPGPLRYEKNV